MNKLSLSIATLFLVISGCSKEETNDTCLENMLEHFANDLACRSDGSQTDLYRGLYLGETVYFPQITCMNCLVVPPERGYNCNNQEVKFTDPRRLTGIEKVYDTCLGQYWNP